MKYLIIAILSFFFTHSFFAQNATELSFETQVYPTGVIPGIRWSKGINNTDRILLRLGYNWFRHRDLGVHDDERGGGLGGTIGYLKYFNPEQKGWHVALKSDIWFNNVDWSDDIPPDKFQTGETSIVVLQPTVELGYTVILQSDIVLIPTLGFGFEWNVQTEGEPTGEGAILLVGIQIGKRF